MNSVDEFKNSDLSLNQSILKKIRLKQKINHRNQNQFGSKSYKILEGHENGLKKKMSNKSLNNKNQDKLARFMVRFSLASEKPSYSERKKIEYLLEETDIENQIDLMNFIGQNKSFYLFFGFDYP